jgi:hypothetical protein
MGPDRTDKEPSDIWVIARLYIYITSIYCVLVFTVFCIVCTAFFVLFCLCTFILICFVCTSVRTTATE